ncbi:hypothetical protein INR49_001480 [Caranx melampygus]|nr:hypothetical protein INR49_001480 [Caranx melampygus]
MGTVHLFRLLSLFTGITALQQVKSWMINVPTTVTAVEGSCAVVPCQTQPHSHVTWYKYHKTGYPVVYDKHVPEKAEEQFRGRTSVRGNATEGNCTLMIENVRKDDNNVQVYVWIYPELTKQRFYDQTVTIIVDKPVTVTVTVGEKTVMEGGSVVMELVMGQPVKSEVILSVYIISFLIGLPANLLALYAFSTKIHSKPLPTDILLLNLTVSDLLFLIILPLKMCEAASNMEWNLPYFLCSITSFTFFSTIYTSSLLLMVVSVVRYIAVAHPITYHKLQKPVYAIVISAIIWLVSAGHCSIVFVAQHHPSLSSNNTTVCYEDFSDRQLRILLPVRLEFFFVLCLVPLLICVYCYSRCIYILYSRPRISIVQKQKAIGMALGTLAVFLICVIPYNFSHVVGYSMGFSPKWRYYTLLLSTFNTCIDPIIFYFSSSTFQCNSDKSIFRKRAPGLHKQGTSSS